MKFSNTYDALQYYYSKETEIHVTLKELYGGIIAEVGGAISKKLKLYLEDRFSEFGHAFQEKKGWQFKFDGVGTIKDRNGQLFLHYLISNRAFPHENSDNESNLRFVNALSVYLYEYLDNNGLINLKNNNDETENNLDETHLPIEFELTTKNKCLEKSNIIILDHNSIKKLTKKNQKDLATTLYKFIKNENEGTCDFSYSEGDEVFVNFNMLSNTLNIFDLGSIEIDLRDYFFDDKELEI